MTHCESYPPCFGTIYFPTAPFHLIVYYFLSGVKTSFVFWRINLLYLFNLNFKYLSFVFLLPIRWCFPNLFLLYIRSIAYFSTFVYRIQQESVKNISTITSIIRHFIEWIKSTQPVMSVYLTVILQKADSIRTINMIL